MNVTNVATAIREQPLDNRDKLLKEIGVKVDEAIKGITELKSRANSLDPAQREEVNKALQELEKRRTDLQNQTQAARAATPETWPQERAVLSARYALFVSAVASVEVASP
jgi:monomeric isocitrate dehydrogenase